MSSEREPSRRLSRKMRNALVSGVRQARSLATGDPVSAARRNAPGFDQLPGFESIRVQQDLARQIGIPEPFYRLHEARAGAHTMVDGAQLSNFTSYDYLGLNGHPRIVEAVARAASEWGTSVSASRLTSGERPCHRKLEGELARLYDAEAALGFVSGHATNVAVLHTIMQDGDLILHDSLSHNSILVGAQSSSAHRINFPHNDLDALETLLGEHRARYRHCLIVTEGLFSMDGDGPDLARLVEIKKRYGAWLMIDEAHSLGVLGATGRGLFEYCQVEPCEVDIWMGTLSKTLVSCGGYIAGPQALIDFLKFKAPGMVYSVGLPATATVAASTALELMLEEPDRVSGLQANGKAFRDKALAAGFDVGTSWGYAVTPIILGDSLRTVLLADMLAALGHATVPVFPPGVPERMARLRFFLSSSHTHKQIDEMISALTSARAELDRSGVSLANVAAQAVRTRLQHRGDTRG